MAAAGAVPVQQSSRSLAEEKQARFEPPPRASQMSDEKSEDGGRPGGELRG